MKKLLAVFFITNLCALALMAQDYKIAEPYGSSATSGKLSSKSGQKYTYLYDTTLIQAIKQKDEHRVKMLMYAHVNPNEKSDQGFTPLYFAAQYSTPEILTMLLDNGARVNLRSTYNLTPLMAAAAAGRADNVKILIEYGADPNLLDDKELTALEHALNNHQIDSALLLSPITTIKKPTMNLEELTQDNRFVANAALEEPSEVLPEEEPVVLLDEEPKAEPKEEPSPASAQEEAAAVVPAPKVLAYNPTLAEIEKKIEQTKQALSRLESLRSQILASEEALIQAEFAQRENTKPAKTPVITQTTTTTTKTTQTKTSSSKNSSKSGKNK